MHSTVRRNHQSKKFSAGFILVLMLSVWHSGYSQGKQPIEWTKYNFLWVDKMWTYQAGVPRPDHLSAGFDDSDWPRVNTDSIGFVLSDKAKWPGIGVFRHKFDVPDSLRGKRAELIMLTLIGAVEIYLDGKLITKYGKVSAKVEGEVVNAINIPQTPIQILLDDQPSHVLAVCYSNHNEELIKRRWEGFVIMLAPENSVGYTKDAFPHTIISMCIVLSFCLLFWFIYAFYPYRLASLMSALYIANFSLIFVGGYIADSTIDLETFILGLNLWRIGFSANPGWALLFLYAIYFNRLPKRSWIVVALMIVCIALFIFSIEIPFDIGLLIFIPLQIETWRIVILGIMKRKTGFWILATGMLVSLAGSLVAIFDVFHFFPWYITTTQTVLAIITDLSFPLTLALHFAWEFGSANRDLRRQLVSVSDLSRKTIEQEQEKQEILSMQNETLEKQVAERTSEVVAQNKEIEKQRDQVTKTLEELRATQTQLIQSEKMASLGELTAGIAHEIQNPLNFVNNFSELSNELIDEMNEGLKNGNIKEAKAIASDVKNNLEKINHHGKRADAIVKGMLQHSRSSSGVKEPTDINALCEEYLRLSYHGLRAKDKSFNVTLNTSFDEGIASVKVIPQDIGRVILNLLNNAFYAVSEKKKQGGDIYEPMVSIITRKSLDNVLISVKDNGIGISEKVIDKVFQPFFTTKPTGQGTGLGLSLSYDIVKAHGGDLKAETIEGEGSTFLIELPVRINT